MRDSERYFEIKERVVSDEIYAVRGDIADMSKELKQIKDDI